MQVIDLKKKFEKAYKTQAGKDWNYCNDDYNNPPLFSFNEPKRLSSTKRAGIMGLIGFIIYEYVTKVSPFTPVPEPF